MQIGYTRTDEQNNADGVSSQALHDMFRAVVITKLQYASYAWWGFAVAADRPRICGLSFAEVFTVDCLPAAFHQLRRGCESADGKRTVPSNLT